MNWADLVAAEFKDRVRDRTRTQGAAAFVVLNSPPAGYSPFTLLTDGASCFYTVVDTQGRWATYRGIWNETALSLSRAEFIDSSTGSDISWDGDTKQIFLSFISEALAQLISRTNSAVTSTTLLEAIKDLVPAADRYIYFTGAAAATLGTITAYGRSLVAAANAAAAKTLLAIAGADVANTPAGNIAATDVQAAINELDTEKQPLDADLTAIAALANTDGNFIVGNGSAWVAESGATARTSLGLGALATLATVGTSQIDNGAVDNTKLADMAQATIKGRQAGAGTGDPEDLTAAQARTAIGLGTAATQNTGTSGANVPLLNAANTWSANQAIILSGADFVVEDTDTGTDGARITLFHNSASPAASDVIGIILANGKDSAGNTETYAQINQRAVSVTNTTEQGAFDFFTNTNGTIAYRLSLQLGLYTPSATGGDKGADTINASAVYDDNTLLACYVFDAVLDGGTIDIPKWDAKVANVDYVDSVTKKRIFQERTHEPLRKFAARLGGPEDPLDLEKYINHWKTKRHLTSLPNEANFDPLVGLPTGAWIQRLVETVEIQAVHIAQIHERNKALEARVVALEAARVL